MKVRASQAEIRAATEVKIVAARLLGEGIGSYALYRALSKEFHPNSGHADSGNRDTDLQMQMVTRLFRATRPSARAVEKPAMEPPIDVSVDGSRGKKWNGLISAGMLTYTDTPGGTQAPRATDLAIRFSNGDIQVVSAINPDEVDTDQREYSWTSGQENANRYPESLKGYSLTHFMITHLVLDPGKAMNVIGPTKILTSTAAVTEVVTFDRQSPVASGDLLTIQTDNIMTDYNALIGKA